MLRQCKCIIVVCWNTSAGGAGFGHWDQVWTLTKPLYDAFKTAKHGNKAQKHRVREVWRPCYKRLVHAVAQDSRDFGVYVPQLLQFAKRCNFVLPFAISVIFDSYSMQLRYKSLASLQVRAFCIVLSRRGEAIFKICQNQICQNQPIKIGGYFFDLDDHSRIRTFGRFWIQQSPTSRMRSLAQYSNMFLRMWEYMTTKKRTGQPKQQ